MKKFLILFLFFFPFSATATRLMVCDGKTYDVVITNGGEQHHVTLTPLSGFVEEFGPVVSMQIAPHPAVRITEPYDDYCIWNGKIDLQRSNAGNGQGGGLGAR